VSTDARRARGDTVAPLWKLARLPGNACRTARHRVWPGTTRTAADDGSAADRGRRAPTRMTRCSPPTRRVGLSAQPSPGRLVRAGVQDHAFAARCRGPRGRQARVANRPGAAIELPNKDHKTAPPRTGCQSRPALLYSAANPLRNRGTTPTMQSRTPPGTVLGRASSACRAAAHGATRRPGRPGPRDPLRTRLRTARPE